MSNDTSIGTYDVQGIEFLPCAEDDNGCIQFSTTFTSSSDSLGALLAFIPRERRGENRIPRHCVHLKLGRSAGGSFVELRGVSPGDYDVFLYDVEWNGFVKSGPPAVSSSVTVTGTQGS